MIRRLRPHLTYANVMVTLVAFVVLTGGAAYAANTVFSADIVDGEVKTADLAATAVTPPSSQTAPPRPTRSPTVRSPPPRSRTKA